MIIQALNNYRFIINSFGQSRGKILFFATYLTDNPFYIASTTMTKTGADLILFARLEEDITQQPSLRSVEIPESAQAWCFRGVKWLDNINAINKLLDLVFRNIKLEIDAMHMLRLESHFETFLLSINIKV